MAHRASSVRAGPSHGSWGPPPSQRASAVGPMSRARTSRLWSRGSGQAVPVCFQGILHHHGEVGHQHQGRRELAEPGAERVHPHPLRRHHGRLHQGTCGQGAPRLSRPPGALWAWSLQANRSAACWSRWQPASKSLHRCHLVDGCSTAAPRLAPSEPPAACTLSLALNFHFPTAEGNGLQSHSVGTREPLQQLSLHCLSEAWRSVLRPRPPPHPARPGLPGFAHH